MGLLTFIKSDFLFNESVFLQTLFEIQINLTSREKFLQTKNEINDDAIAENIGNSEESTEKDISNSSNEDTKNNKNVKSQIEVN